MISLYFSNGRHAESSWVIIYFQESLLKILKLVLVPSPLSFSELPCEACHGNAMVGCSSGKDTAILFLYARRLYMIF